MRHEFSAKTKALASIRADGKCESCTAPLSEGRYHYDHDIPDALGGDNSLENCRVLCTTCHRDKTGKRDVPRIAKAKRNWRKSRGIKKRSRFPGARTSRFKKKLNGEVIER